MCVCKVDPSFNGNILSSAVADSDSEYAENNKCPNRCMFVTLQTDAPVERISRLTHRLISRPESTPWRDVIRSLWHLEESDTTRV